MVLTSPRPPLSPLCLCLVGRQFSGSCPPGFRYQPLTSPYLREKLGVVGVLGPDQGVVVTGIEAWARGEEGGCPLQEGDVLVEVDGEGGAVSHGCHKAGWRSQGCSQTVLGAPRMGCGGAQVWRWMRRAECPSRPTW